MGKLTVKQYAAKRRVSPVAVTRAMNKNKKLINISSYSKIGRDWVLRECNTIVKINIGKCVVI